MNNPNNLREKVRERYAQAIRSKSCCGSAGESCCGPSKSKASQAITGNHYQTDEVNGISPEMIEASFGCGNPTALSALHAGETVLDLGSGAGLDVLLSARRVGPTGKAFGLDMTDEMLAAANANKDKLGIHNAFFLKGHIEEIPLADNSVDVVISNCVINLSPDKSAVFKEIHRILKPGGRMAVTDIVLLKPLPVHIQESLAAWTGCIAGALHLDDFRQKLAIAGFIDIEIEMIRIYDPEALDFDPAETRDAIGSAFIRAKKTPDLWRHTIDYGIVEASASDWPSVHSLLVANSLPLDGVCPAGGEFFVAKTNNQVHGVIGIERLGPYALLRSLVVAADCRKKGLGKELVRFALQYLSQKSVSEVYLLTNTAESFAGSFGFSSVKREDVPAELFEQSALSQACPTSSRCMKLVLQ